MGFHIPEAEIFPFNILNFHIPETWLFILLKIVLFTLNKL